MPINDDGGPDRIDGGPCEPATTDGGPLSDDGRPTRPDGGPAGPDGGPARPDGGPARPEGGPLSDAGRAGILLGLTGDPVVTAATCATGGTTGATTGALVFGETRVSLGEDTGDENSSTRAGIVTADVVSPGTVINGPFSVLACGDVCTGVELSGGASTYIASCGLIVCKTSLFHFGKTKFVLFGQ